MGYKCKPITQRAKSSPFKMNMGLVYGASDMAKKFVDAAGAMSKGIDEAMGGNKETNDE
jgi:hypothetical protein